MPTGILSPTHLLVVLVVALIVLGPKKLPGAGRALGQGLREFKDSITGAADTDSAPAGLLARSEVAMVHEPAQTPAQTPAREPVAIVHEPAREAVAMSHDSAPMATAEMA